MKRGKYTRTKEVRERNKLASIGHKLDVHHINYDKKNCSSDNLISLCHSCHLKTNYNRVYWENYFSKI